MSIYLELNEKLKGAMRDGDELAKNIIRSIKAKVSEHLVACKLPRGSDVPDDILLKVLAADKKALSKAIAELGADKERSAGLVAEYEAEIAFCDQYLSAAPQHNVEDIVAEVLFREGCDTSQIGKAIGTVMKNCKHLGLDGAEVRKAVEKLLGGQK